MGIYQLKMPHCTYAGLGSVKNLEQIVKKEGTTSALVFTDKGIKACGLLTPVTEILEKTILITMCCDLKCRTFLS